MKKFLITCVAILLFAGAVAFAATDSKNLTISVTVANTAKLTLSAATVSFADADPDVTNPIVSADVITIDAKAKTGAASSVTLTCKANTNLADGGNSIGIANVTWAGADTIGTGFNATGTMSTTADQPVGTWTGSGARQGTQTYSLVNSWGYVPGSYSAVVVYTLTAP